MNRVTCPRCGLSDGKSDMRLGHSITYGDIGSDKITAVKVMVCAACGLEYKKKLHYILEREEECR